MVLVFLYYVAFFIVFIPYETEQEIVGEVNTFLVKLNISKEIPVDVEYIIGVYLF